MRYYIPIELQQMLSEVFWAGFLSTMSGVTLACFGLLYKSKCSDISCCCGLIRIHRNISSEVLEDMARNTELTTTRQHTTNTDSHAISNLQIES